MLRREGYGGNWSAEKKAKKLKVVKYNNNGDYITGWHFPNTEDRPSCADIDDKGNVYCAFKSGGYIGYYVYAMK